MIAKTKTINGELYISVNDLERVLVEHKESVLKDVTNDLIKLTYSLAVYQTIDILNLYRRWANEA